MNITKKRISTTLTVLACFTAGPVLADEPLSSGQHLTNMHVPTQMDEEHKQTYLNKGAKVRDHTHGLPFYGRVLAERGIHLPRTFGIQLIGAKIDQGEALNNLAINLSINTDPPDETLYSIGDELVNVPSVISHSQGPQIKFDAWVLPFMNVFASLGKVTGHADIEVDINSQTLWDTGPLSAGRLLANALGCDNATGRRGDCDPAVPLYFQSDINSQTATIGTVFAFGIKDWFITANASRTITVGPKLTTDIETTAAGVRTGWNFKVGNGHVLTPYVVANYLDLNQTVTGLTGTGLSGGNSLNVRYAVTTENLDKWKYGIGLNYILNDGWMFQGEYSEGPNSDMFILSGTYRF